VQELGQLHHYTPVYHLTLKSSTFACCSTVLPRYGEDKGVIPRVCDALFYFIASQGAKAGTPQFKVDASYLEVYNETITDLLCPPPKEIEFVPLKPKERIKLEAKLKKLKKESPKEVAEMAKRETAIAELSALLDPEEAARQATAVLPKIREDPDKGVVVDNLKHFAVATFEDCNKLLEEGLANRTTGSTAMNASSSRCAFTKMGALNQVELATLHTSYVCVHHGTICTPGWDGNAMLAYTS